MGRARRFLLGPRDPGVGPIATPWVVSVPLVGALIGCLALGVLAWPMDVLLHAAAHVVVP